MLGSDEVNSSYIPDASAEAERTLHLPTVIA